jgi:hypothetical protein
MPCIIDNFLTTRHFRSKQKIEALILGEGSSAKGGQAGALGAGEWPNRPRTPLGRSPRQSPAPQSVRSHQTKFGGQVPLRIECAAGLMGEVRRPYEAPQLRGGHPP